MTQGTQFDYRITSVDGDEFGTDEVHHEDIIKTAEAAADAKYARSAFYWFVVFDDTIFNYFLELETESTLTVYRDGKVVTTVTRDEFGKVTVGSGKLQNLYRSCRHPIRFTRNFFGRWFKTGSLRAQQTT